MRTLNSSSGAFPFSTCPIFPRQTRPSTRRRAYLAPALVSGGNLGYGMSLPYFIDLAPNYDLTLTPTFLSKQGLLGEIDWRQRLSNGMYNIQATGIDQAQPGVFPAFPYGAGDTRLRGSIQSSGNFFLNDMWQFGWNGTWMSDKFFLNDYRLQGINFDNFYFQDVVSTVYLRGQVCAELTSISAPTISRARRRMTTIVRCRVAVAPVFDYNRVFNVPADRTNGLGGELTVDANVANINQTNAAFQSTGLQTFDSAYHLYNVCETQVGNTAVNTYVPGKCMLRGIAGELHARLGTGLLAARIYRSQSARCGSRSCSLASMAKRPNSTKPDRSPTPARSARARSPIRARPPSFPARTHGAFARGMAGAGLEYRFPFTATSSWGTQTITPIAQFIARPNEIIPQNPAQRRFAEPGFRRHEPVRLEQVLRLRSGRRRYAAKLWAPVRRRLRQRRPRQLCRRGIDPGRRAKFLHPL